MKASAKSSEWSPQLYNLISFVQQLFLAATFNQGHWYMIDGVISIILEINVPYAAAVGFLLHRDERLTMGIVNQFLS